eukprot:13719041-Alexandrium_andersonii.AAC.1
MVAEELPGRPLQVRAIFAERRSSNPGREVVDAFLDVHVVPRAPAPSAPLPAKASTAAGPPEEAPRCGDALRLGPQRA